MVVPTPPLVPRIKIGIPRRRLTTHLIEIGIIINNNNNNNNDHLVVLDRLISIVLPI